MAATLDDVADACRTLDALTADRGGPVGMLLHLTLDDAARALADAGRGDWLNQLNEFVPDTLPPVLA